MQPHVVVIPYPLQGHVAPLMKLSHLIVDHGIKVTFVNTEFIHAKLTASMPVKNEDKSSIRLVSIPDGLEPGDDRKDSIKLTESVLKFMPAHFRDLIEKINKSDDDDQISCVIADATIGWALEVAEKMGIKRAAFWPAGPGNLALVLHTPKLIEDGIIDEKGNIFFNLPTLEKMFAWVLLETHSSEPLKLSFFILTFFYFQNGTHTYTCLILIK